MPSAKYPRVQLFRIMLDREELREGTAYDSSFVEFVFAHVNGALTTNNRDVT